MISPKSYERADLRPDQLIEKHMHLVQRIAWHFQGRVGKFAEIEDLIQAGYLGLVDASQRYNVRDGVSFSSYAAIRIRGSIVDLLRRNSNLCRASITMRQKMSKAQRTLEHKLGRRPEPEELAEQMDVSLVELKEWEARFQVNQLQSLDEVYSDHSLLFSDHTPSQEDMLEQNDMKRLLREAIEELPEREALVLQLYYVEEMNVYEIAAVLDVTTGRVSQIKKAAILRLRDIIERKSK